MTVTPDPTLASLADEYWRGWIAFNPTAATALGVRRLDDRMPNRSPASIAAGRARLAGLRERVLAIDPGALDPGDRITRSELVATLESDLGGIDAGLETWTVDPLEGPPVELLNVSSYQLVATPQQATAMVRRWQAMGPYLDGHIANLRRGLADGKVAVRSPVERVIDELVDVARTRDDELALLHPLAVEHPDWPTGERSAFERDLRAAVSDVIRPALGRYRAFLEAEIYPAARPDAHPGIVHLPGGAEAYRGLIRLHTSLDATPEELHEVGQREVERIDAEMGTLGARVLGTGGRAETVARLRSDPALYFATRDEVYETAAAAVARAKAAIPAWFGILPRADCVVVRMGEHEEKHSTIAYYRQPAVDGSRPGEYYLNTSEPSTRPRYEAEALAFHESIPGHHLQIAVAQELVHLPEFRRHLGMTAFWEGWGLYVERLADEMGLYSGDLARLGILSFDAWRACRLVVDTGMHAFGWSRADAIAFMTEHTALAPNNIANEVDRYIVWPGQALAYKTGQLEILRLRADAQAALGERFEIRGFHDAVLGSGAVTLRTLAGLVDGWVASRS